MTKVIASDISDHYMLYTEIPDRTTRIIPEEDSLKWNLNRRNIILFQRKIKHVDFSDIKDIEQAQQGYTSFIDRITREFIEAFPKVSANVKYKNRLPWLTIQLKNMIKTKNKLYYKSVERPTQINCNNYKNYKRELNRELRKAERDYIHKAIISSASKPKTQWNIINKIINKKTVESYPLEFVHQNSMISNEQEIADGFNNYFANIPTELDKQIPKDDDDPATYIRGNNPNSFFLDPVTKLEVTDIYRNIKNKQCRL